MKRSISLLIIMLVCINLVAVKVTIVTEDLPPYNYLENEKVVGVGTEIVQTAFKNAGVDFEIKVLPWARAYNIAQKQENTLIYSMGRNEKRENLFKWVAPIVPYSINVYKLKSRTNLKIKGLDDLRKYTIGVVRDDFRMQFFEKEGFKSGENLDVAAHDDFNLKKIIAERIDFVPINSLSIIPLCNRNKIDVNQFESVLTIIDTELWMAFSKQTDDAIVKKVIDAVNKMKADGTYDKIISKYIK